MRWDQNAYGSIVWVLLACTRTHLITDLGDTLVLTALMFTRHAHGKRFSDVKDNAFYWYFVVATWLPIYVLDLLGAAMVSRIAKPYRGAWAGVFAGPRRLGAVDTGELRRSCPGSAPTRSTSFRCWH